MLAWTGATLLALVLLLVLAMWLLYMPRAQQPPYRRVATWGQPGSAPGQFNGPNGIAVHGDRVYVADSRNHRIQIFDRQGHFQSLIGVGPQGLLPRARPMNLNIAGDKLYAADYWNDAVQVFSLDGRRLLTLGGKPGSGPGRFKSPAGASATPDGDIVVADFYNQRVQILSPRGAFIRQLGKTGEKFYVSGGGFNYPTDVAVAPTSGDIYVADGYNDRIQEFGAGGKLLRKWGGPLAINIRGGFNGWFKTVTSVALGPAGDVFVVDEENQRIQKFDPDGRFLTAFGIASKGTAYAYEAVAVAADGTVYTAGNDMVQVWRQQDD